MTRRLLIQRNIVVQLGRLGINLSLIIRTLRLLNLKSLDLSKQLQNLVLDLSVLESGLGGTVSRGADGWVESLRLCVFGCYALGL